MKKLPIGIQSIGKILSQGDYVYVDKTPFIKQLLDEGSPYYFISRPRRFGKSLFLDTLYEVFSGNKELFKGCGLYESDYDWQSYPVVYLDFSKVASTTPNQLEKSLKVRLEIIAKEHGVSLITADIQVALDTLVVGLANKYKSRVVILIDEYDKPIINRLEDLDIARKNRDILRDFFGTIKSLDKHLKFTFITGISKVSQVSLFSSLNNLNDITMDPKYAGIMGYTEEELRKAFKDHIQQVVHEKRQQDQDASEESVIDEVRSWYNGYRFSKSDICVYNPFSTLNFMSKRDPSGYWYSTGTPSFLINQIRKQPQLVTSLRGKSVLRTTLSDISNLDRIHLSAMMFQTGYLTIKGYNSQEDSYQLDFPNREVEQAFFNSLIEEFTEAEPLIIKRAAKEIFQDMELLRIEAFIAKINIHFSKVAYHLFNQADEGFYQAVFFTLLEVSGIKTFTEIATNTGRIDLVCETPNAICIFELKLDIPKQVQELGVCQSQRPKFRSLEAVPYRRDRGDAERVKCGDAGAGKNQFLNLFGYQTADIAFKQAEERNYKERYSLDGKDILVLGVNFSSKSRSVADWVGMLYSSSGELKQAFPSKKVQAKRE
ncbi:ATP-binding protein [Candidatus Neptunochlamydia vexilliferae]|uniref:AAA-ATPase-like domain-containing protein n=1 Tax=Candidatus Neptunichlamydia vexilliferae TaxID=1651774 RepID=A0ABS0AYK0_9BACT|nr:ATP-binding protein [Candidatus Neptunochlamydia vexilliferae]MBF5059040.1 hypothetical protein [Candidatus Neptunochlamydia vexilliferae]